MEDIIVSITYSHVVGAFWTGVFILVCYLCIELGKAIEHRDGRG